jgi:hypothetical protein
MTHSATPTFWLEPTDEVAWGLRRYAFDQPDDVRHCAASPVGVHEALVYVGRASRRTNQHGVEETSVHIPHEDPRWPVQCAHCDYTFIDTDRWQDWQERIWRRANDAAEYVLHRGAPAAELGIAAAPPGASWDAYWMPDRWRGADGIALMVRLPDGHDWHVDSEASNCTRMGEPHQCWVRHGDPRKAEVTVDKNGDTCAAGAGSIASPGYHGFLQRGTLTAG